MYFITWKIKFSRVNEYNILIKKKKKMMRAFNMAGDVFRDIY